MNAPTWNWQQKGWPKATCNRAALRDELKAFAAAFRTLKKALKAPQDMEVVARALTDEAVKTSAIEGVNVDESVAMSFICKALGVKYASEGLPRKHRWIAEAKVGPYRQQAVRVAGVNDDGSGTRPCTKRGASVR